LNVGALGLRTTIRAKVKSWAGPGNKAKRYLQRVHLTRNKLNSFAVHSATPDCEKKNNKQTKIMKLMNPWKYRIHNESLHGRTFTPSS